MATFLLYIYQRIPYSEGKYSKNTYASSRYQWVSTY